MIDWLFLETSHTGRTKREHLLARNQVTPSVLNASVVWLFYKAGKMPYLALLPYPQVQNCFRIQVEGDSCSN